ncbi:hypothetical protein Tco_0349562 [Tanacetum coccineum]
MGEHTDYQRGISWLNEEEETAGESSVAGTTGVVTIVGVYGPLRMHFRKASPFGLVSMYRKNRDRHCAYRPVASIGGRSLEPAVIMFVKHLTVGL